MISSGKITKRQVLSCVSGLSVLFALAVAACSSDTTTGPAPRGTADAGTDRGAVAAQDSGTGGGDGGGMGNGEGGGMQNDAAAIDAAPGAFGGDCTGDNDCTSKVCFMGGSRSFCSSRCDSGAGCPNPPTTGTCNKQGYCK